MALSGVTNLTHLSSKETFLTPVSQVWFFLLTVLFSEKKTERESIISSSLMNDFQEIRWERNYSVTNHCMLCCGRTSDRCVPISKTKEVMPSATGTMPISMILQPLGRYNQVTQSQSPTP